MTHVFACEITPNLYIHMSTQSGLKVDYKIENAEAPLQ